LAAISLTVLEGAGVAGALMAGTLSDRLGRPRVLLLSLAVAPLMMFAFLWAPDGLAAPLLAGLGLTALSGTPVIMALVQDQFPDNRALANGLYLAVSFSTRALATWAVGLLADRYGLTSAFMWSGVIALFGLPALLKLPR
jgi:FSR family fosmidomycin resistance protein-like MFS transporter